MTAAGAALLLALATPAAAADEARALNQINALGCKGCHSLKGEGGTLAPALDGVGKRMGRDQIQAQLLDPKKKNPRTMMPSYAKQLPPPELKNLVDYLAGLK
jgi:mono/diheme cytochrome c family protein